MPGDLCYWNFKTIGDFRFEEVLPVLLTILLIFLARNQSEILIFYLVSAIQSLNYKVYLNLG